MEKIELVTEVDKHAFYAAREMLVCAKRLAKAKHNGWVIGVENAEVTAALADFYQTLHHVDFLPEDRSALAVAVLAGVLDVKAAM